MLLIVLAGSQALVLATSTYPANSRRAAPRDVLRMLSHAMQVTLTEDCWHVIERFCMISLKCDEVDGSAQVYNSLGQASAGDANVTMQKRPIA